MLPPYTKLRSNSKFNSSKKNKTSEIVNEYSWFFKSSNYFFFKFIWYKKVIYKAVSLFLSWSKITTDCKYYFKFLSPSSKFSKKTGGKIKIIDFIQIFHWKIDGKLFRTHCGTLIFALKNKCRLFDLFFSNFEF